MPILNAQVFLNSFSDTNSSNAPSLNNVRWCRDLTNLVVANPSSQALVVPAGQTVTLVSQSTPKRLVYIESDQAVTLNINSVAVVISPLVTGTTVLPAIYMSSNQTTALTVHNAGGTDANLFIISAE